MRDRGGAQKELAVGERGVEADRLARDQRREREEVQRVDRVARSTGGERFVGGAEVSSGIGTVGTGRLVERDLGPHPLAESPAQRGDDEEDDRGTEDSK